PSTRPRSAATSSCSPDMNRRDFCEALGALTLAGASAGAAARRFELPPTANESTPPAARDAEFDPVEQSIAQLSRAQSEGHVSAEVLTRSYLRRIERYDRQGPKLGAVLALNPDALAAARNLDATRRAGKTVGPLHGIPLLIKDNIETRDPLPTTAGSL